MAMSSTVLLRRLEFVHQSFTYIRYWDISLFVFGARVITKLTHVQF